MRALIFFLGLLLSLTASASSTWAAWYKVETPKFIFYGTSAKDIEQDAQRLERYDALLRRLMGMPATSDSMKLTVYVLSDTEAVQRAYGIGAKDVAGFYTANPSGVIAVVPRSTTSNSFEDIVLFHEYAHHLMLHYFPVAYPAWYVEGFAEYLSTVQFTPKFAKVGLPASHRGYELLVERTTPIEKLLSASVSDLKRAEVGNFYGRSWLLTHFLSFEPKRKGQQAAYLKKINEGMPALEAARSAFGDLNILNKDLDRYLQGNRMSYMQLNDIPSPVAVTVTELDKAAGLALLEKLALTRGTRKEEREPIAARLRKLTGQYPGNATILTLLAEAELDLGNLTAAATAADAAIAIEPANARALLWKGLSLSQALTDQGEYDTAKWKTARNWIVRANRANPDDPLPLFEYYRSFNNEGRKPPAASIAGLERAVQLIPQEDALRVPLAFEKTKEGDFEMAAFLLQPMANSPHAGDSARWAKRAVDILKAAAAKPVGSADAEAILSEINKSRDEKDGSEEKP
jgi:tetratricopeptide (TPR) repeat protein